MRVIQARDPLAFVGVAIGWGIPGAMDPSLRAALPGWVIVGTDETPLTTTWNDVLNVRRMARVPAECPVILFGCASGCSTVAAALLSGVWDPWAVVLFDGSHPSGARDAAVFARFVSQVRDSPSRSFLATAQAVPESGPQDSPWWSGARVLRTALGLGDDPLEETLEPGVFVSLIAPPSERKPPRFPDVSLLARLAPGPQR